MKETTQKPTSNVSLVDAAKLIECLQKFRKFRSRFGWVKFLVACLLIGVSGFIYASNFLELEIGSALVKASMTNEHVSNLTNLSDMFLPPVIFMAYTICFVYAGIVLAFYYINDSFNGNHTKAKLPMETIAEAGGLVTAAAITPAAIKSSWGLGIALALYKSLPNLGLKGFALGELTNYTWILLGLLTIFLIGTFFIKKNHVFSIKEFSEKDSISSKLINSYKLNRLFVFSALIIGVLMLIVMEILQLKGIAESWSSLGHLVTDYCIDQNVCGTCPAKD